MNNKEVKTIEVVDIAAVSIDNPTAAIKKIKVEKPQQTIKCDVFIAGGGLGGVAAALKLKELKRNKKLQVVLSEETNWLGGQATAQGVSALDENLLVETTGCTSNYQKFRRAIRNSYKSNNIITEEWQKHSIASPGSIDLTGISHIIEKYFDPGNCWVSRLAFEPKVAVEELKTMLAPALVDNSLAVLYRHKPFYVEHKHKFLQPQKSTSKIKSVYLVNLENGQSIAIKAKLFLDATEFGDLLALTGEPYSVGEESKQETGEPHAPQAANQENNQDFTYPFVVEYRPGEQHAITKPPLYEELNKDGKFSLGHYKMFANSSHITTEGQKVELLPFWTYRRLIDSSNFLPATNKNTSNYPNDLSMINWSSNDVRGKNLIDQSATTQAERLAYGKLVSLGFLYWLQTEAPRDDNAGKGYPELLLRKDVVDTEDGLSKHPYIRESRRIKAKYTIVEQDIAKAFTQGKRAKLFSDSVGIGLYPIDVHGEEGVPGAGQLTRPFQIPLGALLPEKFSGLLPACKNIGVTHITNGAYRLHTIEWAIGEAQGALSLYALNKKINPTKVFDKLSLLRDFQRMLIESGVPVYWFRDLPPDHPAFAAGQYLALTNIMPGIVDDLHFYPDKPITHADAAAALAKLFPDQTFLASDKNDVTNPDKELSAKEFENLQLVGAAACRPCSPSSRIDVQRAHCTRPYETLADTASISRAQFAIWLYSIAQSKKLFGKI